MPITPRAAGLAIAIIAAVALSGCSAAEPLTIPKSDPSVKPVFASDADALAAAEKTYTGYLAATSAAAASGGINVSILAPWETAAEYRRDVKSYATMASKGLRIVGAATYSNMTLQSSLVSPSGKAIVVAYLCTDISGTTLLNAADKNVGLKRPEIVPLQVTFESNPTSLQTLIVKGSVAWHGTDFCS